MLNNLDINKELKGKTLKEIGRTDEELVFTTDLGEVYKLYHEQDCCESVMIEDICGDIEDLIGYPLLEAEEVTSQENPSDVKAETLEWQDSFTWTFYKFATIKGNVTVRWYGESNGYYSESVDFARIK